MKGKAPIHSGSVFHQMFVPVSQVTHCYKMEGHCIDLFDCNNLWSHILAKDIFQLWNANALVVVTSIAKESYQVQIL